MGWLIVAFGTVFLLIVGHIQNSQRVEVVKMQQSGSSHLLARQLLSLAAGINDWRYRHTLTNGTVALSALALPVTPDSRIRHVIVASRYRTGVNTPSVSRINTCRSGFYRDWLCRAYA